MADESNDTLDRNESTAGEGLEPVAPEVAAPEPTQEPLKGPDVELPTGEPSPAPSDGDEAAAESALPEPLEGPDVELPTGETAPDADAQAEPDADVAPEAEPEPEPEPEPEVA